MSNEKIELLAQYLFQQQEVWRSLCSPEDADWDEWVERNRDEWRTEAGDLLAFLSDAEEESA